MTNKKYDFLCRTISVADSVGRFDIAEVSQTDEDVQLLMELRDCGWLHIEAGNHYVTLAGKDAYLSEKELRDERTDAATDETKHRVKKEIKDVAFAVLAAVVAAAASAVVAHWLQ